MYQALVKSTDNSSIHPVYLELSNYHHGYISAFDLNSADLEHLKKKFVKGGLISCEVIGVGNQKHTGLKHIRLVPAGVEAKKIISPKVGDLVTAKVVKKHPNGLRVQISDEIFGNVDITEISDEWVANPLG